jgi:phosphogluconate dehydratase
VLEVLTDGVLERPHATADLSDNQWGSGRDMFTAFRANVGSANIGATVFGDF